MGLEQKRHHKFCFLIFQNKNDKIILTWGPYGDLDLHLAIFEVCEVYFGGNCSGAFLDGDVTNGYGPETITIENYYNTTYMVYIYCFSHGNCANTGSDGADIQPYWTIFEASESDRPFVVKYIFDPIQIQLFLILV